jgi:hypothetical protein
MLVPSVISTVLPFLLSLAFVLCTWMLLLLKFEPKPKCLLSLLSERSRFVMSCHVLSFAPWPCTIANTSYHHKSSAVTIYHVVIPR